MDRDAEILILLITFPLVLTAMIALHVWRTSRRATMRCPFCGRRIPKDAVTESGTNCHHCCAARMDAPQEVSPVAEQICRACHVELSPATRVRLWDGHDYCASCVRKVSPQLAHDSAAHTVLEETAPIEPWRVGVKTFIFVLAVALCFFGGIGAFVSLFTGDWDDVPGLIAVAALLGSMVGIPWGIGAWLMYRRGRTTLQISNGTVTVRYGDVSLSHYPLADCQWFVGTTTQSGVLWLPRMPAVLVVLPVRDENEQEVIVPVGFTEQTSEYWTGFLQLAGVPRRTLWEKKRSWLVRAAVVAAGVTLMAALFFGIGFTTYRVIEPVLVAAGLAQDMAEAISWPLFMPGAFLVLTYVLVFWPWQLLPRVPSSKPVVEQKRIRQRAFWGTLFGLLVCFGVMIVTRKQWGAAAKCVAFGETLALTVPFLLHLAGRVSRTELATTEKSLAGRQEIGQFENG